MVKLIARLFDKKQYLGNNGQEKKVPQLSPADLKPVRLVTLAVILVAVSFYLHWNPAFVRPSSVAQIRELVTAAGIWGPLVYIILYTVRPLLLLPSLPFNLAAGILFSPLTGFISLLAGGLGSASVVFVVARWGMGSSLLTDRGGKWGRKLDGYLADKQHGFRRLLWLRVVPVFAYDPVSIVAACTGITYQVFAGATVLGMLPGAFAYCFLGQALVLQDNLPLAVLILFLAFGVPFGCWYFGSARKQLIEASSCNDAKDKQA